MSLVHEVLYHMDYAQGYARAAYGAGNWRIIVGAAFLPDDGCIQVRHIPVFWMGTAFYQRLSRAMIESHGIFSFVSKEGLQNINGMRLEPFNLKRHESLYIAAVSVIWPERQQ